MIVEYEPRFVPERLFDVLKSLTNENGQMWNMFCMARKNTVLRGNVHIYVDNSEIIGWTLLWQLVHNNPKNEWHSYVFVDENHRRKGIATKLVNKSFEKLFNNPVTGYGWENGSSDFWDTIDFPGLEVTDV